MSGGPRLALFAIGLVAVAAAGFGIGALVDADHPGDDDSGMGPMHGAERPGHGSGPEMHAEGGAMDDHGPEGGMRMDSVRGLGVADDGMRLEVADPELTRGATEPLRFRIFDDSGRPVTEFDLTHTKRMHVIVVRRDLTGFQHLHPRMAADGTWSVPLRLAEPGTYRAFADFSVDGEATTLADDLRVDGDADLQGLPAPASTALSVPGGYEVGLRAGDPHAGERSSLRFRVSREGEPAVLQPYLGAGGHLVALREGDLAFLHVHPTGDAGRDGSIDFEASFPTAGGYRLFLQFRVGGELQTVAFTAEVH